MIVKSKDGNEYNIPVQEYIVDTEADVINLPKDAPMGSAAFIVETQSVRFINSQGEWT